MRHERKCLQRLTEAHVVCQDAAEPVLPEKGEPVESVFLVRPKDCLYGGGERGRLDRIEGEEALRGIPPGLGFDGLIRKIFELRPQARLVSTDPHSRFPLRERGGFVDEPLEFVEDRLVE